MSSCIEIKTSRLYLRPISINDADTIFNYRSLPEVYEYQGWRPNSIAETKYFIKTQIEKKLNIPDSWYQIVVIKSDSDELIGDIGLHFLRNDNQQVEIGFTLSPIHQGKGFATEAVAAVVDFLFNSLQKHRVIASVDPRNTKSIQLIQRIGMRKEAHFIKSLWFNNEWVDDLTFAILKEEWIKKY